MGRQAVIDAIQQVSFALDIKTVGQVVKRYDDALTNAVHDTFNGNSDAVDQRRIHKDLLRRLAPEVFMEGMREGGLTDIDDEDMAEMNEAVADWLATQIPHVNGFAADTQAARGDKAAQSDILGRVVLWVNALRELGALGRAYAHNNQKGQWVLGSTREHCADCRRFARMKPHRMSWFRARKMPRSIDLECNGFDCRCDIVDPKTGLSLL